MIDFAKYVISIDGEVDEHETTEKFKSELKAWMEEQKAEAGDLHLACIRGVFRDLKIEADGKTTVPSGYIVSGVMLKLRPDISQWNSNEDRIRFLLQTSKEFRQDSHGIRLATEAELETARTGEEPDETVYRRRLVNKRGGQQ